MALTIWRQSLELTDSQAIFPPAGAQFLCARERGEDISVWFICDPARPTEQRNIAIVGTGHPAPSDGKYLGTASLRRGALIFHVFEGPR